MVQPRGLAAELISGQRPPKTKCPVDHPPPGVHVPKKYIPGVRLIVLLVLVWGEHMIIEYSDPYSPYYTPKIRIFLSSLHWKTITPAKRRHCNSLFTSNRALVVHTLRCYTYMITCVMYIDM